MPPEFSEQSHKPTKAHSAGAPPPEQEQIPCPRCDSINTKFCYYNNYNFSQPRYFCKSCRRYWTQGGTLRDIPFGGGSRKNAKRSRTSTATGTIVSNSASFMDYPPLTTVLVPLSDDSDVKANTVGGLGSFSSLLTTPGAGFLALGGFGFTNGLEGLGFGHERAIWPFPAMSGGARTYAGGTGVEDTWKLKN